MGTVKESEFQKPVPPLDDEDEETLAAIDEGIRDAEAGRTASPEEVRKLLPQLRSFTSAMERERKPATSIWTQRKPRSGDVL